jgi:hypothetical protein
VRRGRAPGEARDPPRAALDQLRPPHPSASRRVTAPQAAGSRAAAAPARPAPRERPRVARQHGRRTPSPRAAARPKPSASEGWAAAGAAVRQEDSSASGRRSG